MQGVIVEFQYGDEFDATRIEAIAREARGRFAGLPGLRQKAFTIDQQNRRATNVYLWDSETAARGFFTDELVGRVTDLYGVRPTITFVEVAELVDNRQ
jgi:Putative mono-oxygenase ydhR